jgi:hypothetical protein
MSRKNVFIWEAATGQKIVELDATGSGYDTHVSFAVSSNGTCLATYSGGDDQLLIWETASGAKLANLSGLKETGIEFFDFVPGGAAVLVLDSQGTAQIFDCDVSGSVDDLVINARKRVKRELTSDERRRFSLGR